MIFFLSLCRGKISYTLFTSFIFFGPVSIYENQYIYRYDAIQHPVEYHANQVNSNQLGRSIKWIVCLQILAIVVSLPLFLEPMVVLVTYTVRDNLNTSHIALVSYHYKIYFKIFWVIGPKIESTFAS